MKDGFPTTVSYNRFTELGLTKYSKALLLLVNLPWVGFMDLNFTL